MKLATYQDGSRDGQLVVVSADLTQAHHASGIATRMQQVLDDWGFLAPQLQDLARTLTLGKARHAFPFEPRMCMAPLPRAFRLVDAQATGGAQQIGAGLAGDALGGPRSALPEATADGDAETERVFGPRLVVALGDVPRGAAEDQARDGVRLLMLANVWQHARQGELLGVSTAWAPVAVTPDELGRAWQRGRLSATLSTSVGDQPATLDEAGPSGVPEAGAWISRLARHRAVTAGTLLALPGLRRSPLAGSERVEIDARDALGQSVFGSILQRPRSPDDLALPG